MPSEYSLYEKLSAMGISISSNPYPSLWGRGIDIEKTLMDAAACILSGKDSRILSLLLSWIKYNGEQVNIERLKKLIRYEQRDLVWVNLFAFYGMHCKQSRWKILAKPAIGRMLASGNLRIVQAQAKYKGEEPWAKGTGFIVPLGSEGASEKWVLTAQQIAKMSVM